MGNETRWVVSIVTGLIVATGGAIAIGGALNQVLPQGAEGNAGGLTVGLAVIATPAIALIFIKATHIVLGSMWRDNQ